LRIIDVKRAVNAINPDVLHALYASHYGVYAALSGFHPLIISALGSDILISPERSKMFRFSLQFALRKADLVHVADEGGRKTLIELGCDPRKILTQEWGVDTVRFAPNAKSEPLRQRLEIQDCYSVLSASSWQIDYSVDVLIRAIPLVLKQLPNVKFILLGGGVLEGDLKALAKKLGVHENVMFVGRIPYEEMPMYLASVDVFVDTISDYAHAQGRTIKRRSGMGIGQTTKEAMACGTPVIASNNSSIPEIAGEAALLTEAKDAQTMANTMSLVLHDDLLRANLVSKGQKRAEIFSWDKCALQTIEVYKKVMLGRQPIQTSLERTNV